MSQGQPRPPDESRRIDWAVGGNLGVVRVVLSGLSALNGAFEHALADLVELGRAQDTLGAGERVLFVIRIAEIASGVLGVLLAQSRAEDVSANNKPDRRTGSWLGGGAGAS